MFKPQYKQLINVDGIEFKPSDVCKSWYIATEHHRLHFQPSHLTQVPQLLKCDTDMVASYRVVPYLQRCRALLVTGDAVHDELGSTPTRLLKMLHKRCNMEMLGVLLI